MSGEKTYWRFEQALDFVVHRDISSVREAPSFFSERDWPSEVLESFWSLWRALETGTVQSIEHGRTVPPLRWCNDRLALEEYEEAKGVIGLIHFIVMARGVTRDVSIPVADLLAAFPVPPAATPEVAKEAALPAQPVAFEDVVSAYCSVKGSAKNREEADAIVEERFGPISKETRTQARKAAGFSGKSGRPKKPGQ